MADLKEQFAAAKGQVIAWDFAQTEIQIAPVSLVGQGGAIFGNTRYHAPIPVGAEVRFIGDSTGPYDRRPRYEHGTRGVIKEHEHNHYLVETKDGDLQDWFVWEAEEVPVLELLGEAG